MKSSTDMTNSLIRRKNEYFSLKQKKKSIALRIIPCLALCIFSLIGFLAVRKEINTTPPLENKDSVYQGVKDNFDELNGESVDNKAQNNLIKINAISAVNSDKMFYNLNLDDFVKMSKEELNEYYGINVFPAIPNDIKEWPDGVFGVFKRNGGNGEAYFDQNIINYTNHDFSRRVSMEINKGSLPILDYVYLETVTEKSIVNNLEVIIGYSESSGYHASFMYKNVGFCINGDGLTQDEFINVLSSVII